jgi:hypothetical protein
VHWPAASGACGGRAEPHGQSAAAAEGDDARGGGPSLRRARARTDAASPSPAPVRHHVMRRPRKLSPGTQTQRQSVSSCLSIWRPGAYRALFVHVHQLADRTLDRDQSRVGHIPAAVHRSAQSGLCRAGHMHTGSHLLANMSNNVSAARRRTRYPTPHACQWLDP